MRRNAAVLVLGLASACSGPVDRTRCSADAPCPAGQACVATSEGGVCWPDATPPAVTGVQAGCAGPCVRDGTLTVRAQVTDDHRVGEVRASLDLDGHARSVALAGPDAQGTYSGRLSLAEWSFPWFEHAVRAKVTARDAAGNEAAGVEVDGGVVTRKRWATPYSAGAPVTAPAVSSDGTVLVGVSATADQLRAVKPDGTELKRVSVGTAFVTAAPSIGTSAIWVASTDKNVYAVKPDLSAAPSACATGGAVTGTPALSVGSSEVAFVGSGDGFFYGASATATCKQTERKNAFEASAAIAANAVHAIATPGTLYALGYETGFSTLWTAAPVTANWAADVSVDGSGSIWTVSRGGQLCRPSADSPSCITTTLAPVRGSAIPIAATSGFDVLVGDATKLHRIRADGTDAWAVALAGSASTPMLLAGGDAEIVIAAGGSVYALRAADGSVVWSGELAPGQVLTDGNLFTAPGATTSTAYFGADDGKLHAVVVDGHLDSAAPWPKAHHDARNTGNAATPIP